VLHRQESGRPRRRRGPEEGGDQEPCRPLPKGDDTGGGVGRGSVERLQGEVAERRLANAAVRAGGGGDAAAHGDGGGGQEVRPDVDAAARQPAQPDVPGERRR
jgi:hypothetical protein